MNTQPRRPRDVNYKKRFAVTAIALIVGVLLFLIGIALLYANAPLISAGVQVDLTLSNVLIIAGSIITITSVVLLTYYYYTWIKQGK